MIQTAQNLKIAPLILKTSQKMYKIRSQTKHHARKKLLKT